MTDPLARFQKDFHLKEFVSLYLSKIGNPEDIKTIVNDINRISPFIKKFSTTYINYYNLRNLGPFNKNTHHSSRLIEFYSELIDVLLSDDEANAIHWIFEQRISSDQPFFPSKPVPRYYQDLSRGLALLTELVKVFTPVSDQVAENLSRYAESILTPAINRDVETEARETLDHLIAFNARQEGIDSETFRELTKELEVLKENIQNHLIGNNTFISIAQQISEINKALKSVFITDFKEIFQGKEKQLKLFWQGLKTVGYIGGDQILSASFPEVKPQLERWLSEAFNDSKSELLDRLEAAHHRQELPIIEREQLPEAIQLHALNLLGMVGLRDDRSIRLALSFCSQFITKTVRECALRNVRRNDESVKRFFYLGLKNESDYRQCLSIASRHDEIFEKVTARSILLIYGEPFARALEALDQIIGPYGFWLSDFIKSAYQIQPGETDTATLSTDTVTPELAFIRTNENLGRFRDFIESYEQGVFHKIIDLWGLSYVVSWALADYKSENRLFGFIASASKDKLVFAKAYKDRVIPLNDIIMLLAKEPDAKRLIEKLMTFLLNSKISFDFPLFQSLFRVVAQREAQLTGGILIRDGFSEQRGYERGAANIGEDRQFALLDPHIFHPIVIFLISILNMKKINIPKDAFIETDISFYLNSLAAIRNAPEMGYQTYLAHKLISSIPYIVDFSSHHETIIRKTIADLDESYGRKNILIHYLRIKIHRAPSKLDLDYCLAILEGLSKLDTEALLSNLIQLMRGVGDEAIPDLREYFEHFRDKLDSLGKHLKVFKNLYRTESWFKIAEDRFFKETVLDLPGIDNESIKDILALVKLANALSNYWTQRVNQELLQAVFSENEVELYMNGDLEARMAQVREKRIHLQKTIFTFDPMLEPYQHIFIKRHVIQSDWNFDFFGFWPFYSENKFETYNLDRKLALLERELILQLQKKLDEQHVVLEAIDDASLSETKVWIDCLARIMTFQVDEGLAPSKFFLDTLDILKNDQLTISQLYDILSILYYRELAHVDTFIANIFGHFPERITKALGRENLDFQLANLSQEDDELLYPLVQETVLGNILASARPIPLLERTLSGMLKNVTPLKILSPASRIYPETSRPPRESSPVYCGYKSYALKTLEQDGFDVPFFETVPVHFFSQIIMLPQKDRIQILKEKLIDQILSLEEKSEKRFNFKQGKLKDSSWRKIETKRDSYTFDINSAPELLVSARSGSYRSMPGILGTVLNVGCDNISKSDNSIYNLNVYQTFLSSFGTVAAKIKETEFSRIISRYIPENETVGKFDNPSIILQIISDFKALIQERYPRNAQHIGIDIDWDDPLNPLMISVLGVWYTWDSEDARKLREFLDISEDWKTAVILMEMKMANKNEKSFSAILFSGDPQGRNNKPYGDVLFGRPGEDIASGLASEGTALEILETENPPLYQKIVDLLEAVKVNKGNIDVDVEMVGEYDEETGETRLFVVQERQMPLGAKTESEEFILAPNSVPPVTSGIGVNGGAQYGVFLDGVNFDYYQLRKIVADTRAKLGDKDQFHGLGIFLLMDYVTPGEALKMNIPGVDGIVTTKIGKSSHASISAKRDGKLFICEAKIERSSEKWLINRKPIKTGDEDSPDIYTLVAYPKSVSPYSGNIYEGKIKLQAR